MKWIGEWCCFHKHIKYTREISNCRLDVCNAEINVNWKCFGRQSQKRSFSSNTLLHDLSSRTARSCKMLILFNNVINGFERHTNAGSHLSLRQTYWSVFRHFGKITQKEPRLSRDWLVRLWLEERRLENSRLKMKGRAGQHFPSKETMFQSRTSFQPVFRKWFAGRSVAEERFDDPEKSFLKEPPLSQSATGFLSPTSQEEARVEPLLGRANLLITRDIEWANLMLGFEQESKYAVVDPCYPQAPVGFIREKSNFIFRQSLRSRRPFIACITDAMGNELFRVRRPIWLINSTIYAEVDGKEVGVVHRRWHLWKRIYDLYLGNKQFAVVENPGFWNWTFTLKDADGNVLAEINRDWRGIGFELFTDAGQYVIRFGHADPHSKTGLASAIQELEISRPLTLSERAVAVALAVSLDSDYFSRHGGWGLPILVAGE